MPGPDLHVFTLKFSALKNWGFFTFHGYYATFHRGCYSAFKEIKKKMTLKKLKNGPQKVAHNRSRPFYFTVQPKPQPTVHSPDFFSFIL